MSQSVAAKPSVEITVGTVFSWGERSILEIKREPVDLRTVVKDGYVLIRPRPRHWWFLVSWVRLCRDLWRLPDESEWPVPLISDTDR